VGVRDVGRGALRGVAVDVEDGDGPAVAGQPVAGRPADPAGGSRAGDDRGALGGQGVVT
jgi:hypothetical protein